MSDLTDMVLEEVREMGPVTAVQVAGGLGLKENTARAALQSLEKAGLLVSDNYQLKARVWLAMEGDR